MVKGKVPYVVKRTATGLGLVAARPIGRGKRIIEYVGPVVTTEEVNRRRGRFFFELDDDSAIDGTARTNLARYINHSCRPNAEAFITGRRIWIWSRRGIAEGEQITINYGKEYFDDYIKPVGCKCDACAANGKKKTSKSKKKPSRAKKSSAAG